MATMAKKYVIFRLLDPGDALAEILFGLIMVLTFTIGARLITADTGINPHELILAAVGCNVAWGVIDAVFFILGTLFYRSQRARFFRQIKNAANERAALLAVQEEFGLEEEPLTASADDRALLHQSILVLAAHSAPARVRLVRSDFISAFCVFALVAATAIPAVIPFLFIEDAFLALRTSNLVLVLLLFIVGYSWAHFTDARPLYVGLSVMLLGVVMVCIAVALGG